MPQRQWQVRSGCCGNTRALQIPVPKDTNNTHGFHTRPDRFQQNLRGRKEGTVRKAALFCRPLTALDATVRTRVWIGVGVGEEAPGLSKGGRIHTSTSLAFRAENAKVTCIRYSSHQEKMFSVLTAVDTGQLWREVRVASILVKAPRLSLWNIRIPAATSTLAFGLLNAKVSWYGIAVKSRATARRGLPHSLRYRSTVHVGSARVCRAIVVSMRPQRNGERRGRRIDAMDRTERVGRKKGRAAKRYETALKSRSLAPRRITRINDLLT